VRGVDSVKVEVAHEERGKIDEIGESWSKCVFFLFLVKSLQHHVRVRRRSKCGEEEVSD